MTLKHFTANRVPQADRAEIDRQAEKLAGKWKDYNDDPTPGKKDPAGHGAHTPVPAGSGIAWDVYVPPKTTKALKVREVVVAVGRAEESTGLRQRRSVPSRWPVGYPAGRAFCSTADRAVEVLRHSAQQGREGMDHTQAEVRQGRGLRVPEAVTNPNGLRQRPEQSTRQPRNTKPVDERAENDDGANYAEPSPIYSGKRSPSEQGNTMKPDTWNVSASWTSKGQFLPGMKWSERTTNCLICGRALPGNSKRRYCPGDCARLGANLVRRVKKGFPRVYVDGFRTSWYAQPRFPDGYPGRDTRRSSAGNSAVGQTGGLQVHPWCLVILALEVRGGRITTATR